MTLGEEAFESDLIDLTGLNLDDVAELPESSFATVLRRILNDVDQPDQYVGFQNQLD